MIKDIPYKEILPRVFVYPGLISNHKEYSAILDELHNGKRKPYLFQKPENWSIFGTTMSYTARFNEPHLLEAVAKAIQENPENEKDILA